MRSTLTCLVLAVGLLAVIAPRSADAQEKQGEAEAEAETEGSDDQVESGSSGSSEETASTSEEDRTKANEGDEEGGDSGDESGETADRGPGGRKLRKDYPGTEESKKGQMESDRIEGLEFEEGSGEGQPYDVKIQELETEVNDLKEEVFQSKSRVVLLKETVLGGNLSGSRAIIVHANDLGGQFKLQRAMYSLDGNRVFNESQKTGGLKEGRKFRVYEGSISAGSHNVSILLEYEGSGYGVFNYMKGYRMKITSSCEFKAEAGKATVLRVSATKKGGALRDPMTSADVKCEIETSDISQDDVEGGNGEGVSSESSSSEQE